MEAIQFLDHQRHGAIGPPAVVIGLVVSAGYQPAEQVDVDAAVGLRGLRKLSGKEAVHEGAPKSALELGRKWNPDAWLA